MSISPLLQGISTNKVAGSNFQTNFYLSKNTLNNHSYVIWASISDQQQNDSGDIFYGVGNSFSLGVSPSDHSLSLKYNGETTLIIPNAYEPNVITQFAVTFQESEYDWVVATLYVNGIAIGSTSLLIQSTNNCELLFLHNLAGNVKYVRIYESCLSATELYNNTFELSTDASENVIAELNYSASIATDILNNYTTTVDAGNTIEVENAGVIFDGNSALIGSQLPTPFGLSDNEFTIQTWVYLDSTIETTQCIFSNQSSSGGFSLYVHQSGDELIISFTQTGSSLVYRSADEIQAYMYHIPSYDDTLVAFYNFSTSPPDLVNNQTVQPIGNPTPFIQKTSYAIGSQLPEPANDTLPPNTEPQFIDIESRKQTPARQFSDGTELYSKAHLEKIVSAYQGFLDPTDANQASKIESHREEVLKAFEAAQKDPMFLEQLDFHVQHHFERDEVVFTFHHPCGKVEEVHRTSRSIDECTIFWISFGITVICAVFAILGVSLVPKKISDFVTLQLIPKCLPAFTNIFVGAITGATMVAVLEVLWENDLLSSLIWTCIQSMGWWGLTKLLAKLIALVIPGADAAAVAAYVAGAAVAVIKVGVAYADKPSSCN